MRGKYFTSFDGAKIYYTKSLKDKNRWLIFLHGLGGDLTAWQKERAYFTKLGISTIALDLRGHGLSDRSQDKDFYKLENFAKDVEVVLDKESIKNAVIVGHCFGGIVSIFFQSQFPNSSKALILIDTSYKPPFFGDKFVAKVLYDNIFNLLLKVMPNLKKAGHADYERFIGTSDLNIRRILSDILHTSLRSYLMISDQLVNLDATTLLNKITVPTLVVEGSKDSIFPPDIAEYLSRRIKNSELDLIEGANHILILNNPQQLEKSINNFLQKINFI